MLPLVDPDYLIMEHDPDRLRAYARGLLHQLRNPSRSYSFEMVKAATVWLVGAYVDARVPLAPEMDGLIAGVVKWNRRASSFRKIQEKNEGAYWAAIRFEATNPAGPQRQSTIGGNALCSREACAGGGWLPTAADAQIEKEDSMPGPDAAQKSAEATIRGWRKLDHYRQNVFLQRDLGAYLRQMLTILPAGVE